MAGPSRPEGAREAQDQAVDQRVGANIRLRRRLLRMSQSTLAEQLGLTFQQVQKYEKGVNRVSASTLWRIAGALGSTVEQLFTGIAPPTPSGALADEGEMSPHALASTLLASEGGLGLATAWQAMDADQRRAILAAAKAFAQARPKGH